MVAVSLLSNLAPAEHLFLDSQGMLLVVASLLGLAWSALFLF
ncbi:hypothetical protein JCM19231_3725 [Vibrio ishigakensis]|uniref:Uncharacterized protein n=1 Tax=Vibrio ishigakensis TaxID=1481914 RepID=A0A0B8NQP2_9VIBR|nr:hypothetical protein JCM19231_3725 [Vibrio ishigakensis]